MCKKEQDDPVSQGGGGGASRDEEANSTDILSRILYPESIIWQVGGWGMLSGFSLFGFEKHPSNHTRSREIIMADTKEYRESFYTDFYD